MELVAHGNRTLSDLERRYLTGLVTSAAIKHPAFGVEVSARAQEYTGLSDEDLYELGMAVPRFNPDLAAHGRTPAYKEGQEL